MESQSSINDKIFSTILKIQTEYPELVKFLEEMPVHYSSVPNKGVNNKDLKDYLNSLNELKETYNHLK